ncbi:alpha/beta fold hydrolase [Tsuneonella sp. HG222]
MTTAAQAVAAVPLISRDALFGNPSRIATQISPDGKWLGWLQPFEGVLNVHVAPVADRSAARRMTSAKDRPIPGFSFAPDSRSLLYVQDKAGDENFLLYQVDLDSGAERCLTPFEKTRARLLGLSNLIRDKVLVGLNNRDERLHDVHLLDLKTGELEQVFENTGNFAGFLADESLTLRMAMRQNAAGGNDVFDVVDGVASETPRETWGLEDSLSTSPAGFTADGKTLYWIDSRGRNTGALFAEDIETGKRTLIAENEKADIGGTLRHPLTGEVEAFAVNYFKTEWTALEQGMKTSLDWLRSRLDGEFGVMSRTDDDTLWIVGHEPKSGPTRALLFDRTAQTLEELHVSRPELVGAPLQPMQPIEIPSRDGLTLVSYLTLPAGAESPVPLVLLVHGGPWARDGYGLNRHHQLFANRGYAVLSVNFRGSTGFGKDFINAANLEWGRKMHDDLLDAVDWAVAEGIALRDKVAIMGGSYGGYATLAGLAFTPEVFACGVDIVGPSNLETLLETIPPYWEPVVRQFHERMGNPSTPEGKELLMAASPLHSADRICRPLLIGQGANDPRVKQSESDQIVAAMEKHGIPVTYVVFPDEGHGFARPENSIAFMAIAENFLAEILGGRAEPVGATLALSTAEIRTGEDHVKGLEALTA